MGAQKTFYKIVSNSPGGMVGKVAIGGGLLIGGYILVSKITGWNPAGDALAGAAGALGSGIQAVGDAIGTVSKPVGDAISSAGQTVSQLIANAVLNSPLKLSDYTVNPGDTIHVIMKGLQPFQDVRITWTAGFFDTGQIRADIAGNIDVLMTISTSVAIYGTHQINAVVTYIAGDTRTFATNFTVVNPEPPDDPTKFNNLSLTVADSSVTLGNPITFIIQLYQNTTPSTVRKAVMFTWNGDVIDTGTTNSNGKYIWMVSSNQFGRGNHLIYGSIYPPDPDRPEMQDFQAITIQ